MARRIRRVAATLPISNRPMPGASRRTGLARTGRRRSRTGGRWVVSWRGCCGWRRRWHRWPAVRHDGDEDGGTDANDGDQAQGEHWAEDGAEVVHRSLEPVRASVRVGRDGARREGVAGRHLQSTGGPCRRSQDPDLQGRSGSADQAGQNCHGGVAANGRRPTPYRVIGHRTTCESGAGEPVSHSLDDAQRGGRRAQRGREKAWKQRGRHFVACVGQQARAPDPNHSWGAPIREVGRRDATMPVGGPVSASCSSGCPA